MAPSEFLQSLIASFHPKKWLLPVLFQILYSNSFLQILRKAKALKRKATSSRATIDMFYQIDDPYSHLLAQKMIHFTKHYDVDVNFHVVDEPADDVAPERKALERFSLKDAQDIAVHHDLQFPLFVKKIPDDGCLKTMALRAILGQQELLSSSLVKTGEMFWKEDIGQLNQQPMVSAEEMKDQITKGTAMRNKFGLYLGATLHFDGELFWGIDRLPYLEAILKEQGLQRDANDSTTMQPLCIFQELPKLAPSLSSRTRAKSKITETADTAKNLRLEFFISLRSPYSYLAMKELLEFAEDFPITIVWRPVMPMVMRGLPVPQKKAIYILADVKREADRLGAPFGKICDPVGEPVRRGFSLYPYAKSQGKEKEYLYAFTQLAWSEGMNMSNTNNLQIAIERAGLEWSDAAPHLDSTDYVEELEASTVQLFECGLWGVPSYRLVGVDTTNESESESEIFCTWGRDRLWLVCHRIKNVLEARAKGHM